MADTLKEGAPNGIDCFFENVGGEDSFSILNHMNRFGRVSVCGIISAYNNDKVEKISNMYHPILTKVTNITYCTHS